MNAYNEFLDKCHKTNLNKILEIGLYYDFHYNRIICTTKKRIENFNIQTFTTKAALDKKKYRGQHSETSNIL